MGVSGSSQLFHHANVGGFSNLLITLIRLFILMLVGGTHASSRIQKLSDG